MSKEIESRVVEMSFDNKNFEKNVSTSMSTIEKLKKSLNMDEAAKSFNKVESASKNLNFDKLVSAATALEKRFSVFGEMSAVAIQRVTNSMIDLATKTTNFITSGITQGGLKRAMNLEQANFQLQGLLKDTSAVAAIMENVNWSVDGTAYGLDAAAKAASMFAATGMRAGEEMKGALRGVAGVAAMTNSEYDDIARIFTTVAGQGRVMADQFNQLASRGLNAAATLADYLTKVGDGAVVTEAQVREMTSKGQISFATFAAAMDDAFGEHAKAANKTFNGAMSNIRAALARIGADFISPIIKQDTEMIWLLNHIRLKINDIRKLTTPFAGEVTAWLKDTIYQTALLVKGLDFSSGSTAVRTVQNGFKALMNVVTAVKNVFTAVGVSFKEVFPESAGQLILDLSYKLVGLTEKLNPSIKAFGTIRDVSKAFFLIVKDGIDLVKSATKVVTSFASDALGGLNIDILGTIQNLAKTIISFKEMNTEVNLLLVPIGFLVTAFETAKAKVKEWITAFKEIPIVQEIIKNFTVIATPFVNLVKELGSDAKAAIGRFIEAFKEMDGVSFESTKTLLEKLRDILGSGISDIGATIKKIPEAFAAIKPVIEEHLSNIGVIFSAFWDKIKVAFSKIKDFATSESVMSTLVSLLFGAGSIATGYGLIKIIGDIKTNLLPLVQAIPNLIYSISGVFVQLKRSIADLTKSIQFKQVSEGVYSIAKSIAILAAVLVVLAQVPVEDLQKGGTAMLLIATAMAALVAAFSKLDSTGKIDIKGVASTMIGMAASMFILAGTLKKLANMEGNIVQGMAVMTLLIAEMVGAMLLLGKDKTILEKGQKTSNATLSMIAFAASMSSLVKTMMKIASMPLDQVMSSVIIMTTLIIELVAMMKLTSKGGWESGVGMLAMTVSVHVLVAALEKIGDMDLAKLAKAELVMISIAAVLALLSLALRAGGGKNAAINGTGLLAEAAAMLVIGFAIEKLGSLDLATLAKGLAAVTVLGLVFAAITAATSLAGDNAAKVSVTLLAMSGAIAILAGVIVILGQLETESVIKGTAAVSMLMAMFALVIASTKLAEDAKVTLIIVTVAVGMLVAALAVLAAVEPDRVLPASLALSTVMAMFALIVASTAVAKDANKTIIIMALVVAELGGILAGLSLLDTEKMIPAAEALSLLMLSLSAAFLIISKAGDVSTQAVKSLALMGLVVGELGLVLGLLQLLHIEPSMETVEALSLLLIAMTACLAVLATLNIQVTAAVQASVSLGSFITIMSAFIAGLGALYELIPGAKDFLENGLWVLEKVGEGIGRFVGAIIGGALDQMASYLPNISNNLSLFMLNLTPFIVGAKTVDSKVVDGVINIAAAIIAISAAQVIQGITDLLPFTGSIVDFGETLNELGRAMVSYSSIVAGKIAPQSVESSAVAAKALAELQGSLPRTGGAIQEFFGEKMNMGTFGQNLEKFGYSLTRYSAAITENGGIDPEAVESSAKAGKSLAELQSSLPSTGGKLQEWLGEKMDLDVFGHKMATFGYALVRYSTAITSGDGLKVKAIENSAKAAQLLADLQNNLPTVGGKLQEFFGETMNIDDFGKKLVTFGQKLVEYSAALTKGDGLDTTAMGDAAKAAKKLVELQNALPSESGWFQNFFGGGAMDMGEWGESLAEFGRALANYSFWITLSPGIQLDAIKDSVAGAKELAGLQNEIKMDKGGPGTLVTFGNQLKEFGGAFNATTESLVATDHSKLSQAIDDLRALVTLCLNLSVLNTSAMSNFSKSLKDLADVGIKAFVKSFGDATPQVNDAITQLINNAAETITNHQRPIIMAMEDLITTVLKKVDLRQKDFKTAGRELVNQMIVGFDERKESARLMVTQILDYCLKNVNNPYYDKFKDAGINLMGKVISGFEDRKKDVQDKIGQILESGISKIDGYQSDYKGASDKIMIAFMSAIDNAIPQAKAKAESVAETLNQSMRDRQNSFYVTGSAYMLKLSDGIELRRGDVNSTVAKLAQSAINTAASYSFYNVGSNYAAGLANGINDTAYRALAAARNLAQSMDNAIRSTLKINSPSKLAYETGDYYGIGFVNAITDNVKKAYNAAKKMALSASDGLNEAINAVVTDVGDHLNLTPVITPEIDPSKALATAGQINALFNGGRGYSLSARIRDDRAYQNQNGNSETISTPAAANSYQFIQNNYSPKALSRIDIYRQTKNQFSTFKEVTARA